MKAREIINEIVVHNNDYKEFKKEMDDIRNNRLTTIEKKFEKSKKQKDEYLNALQTQLMLKRASDFIDYFKKMALKYNNENKEVNIPISIVPGLAAFIVRDNINKLELKLLQAFLKRNPNAGSKDAINFLLSIQKNYNTFKDYLKDMKLDREDMEKFINKVSKNPTFKKKLNELNKKIHRFAELLAKEKYLY